MAELSDGLLLDGVRQGDEDAFNSLFSRHYHVVYRVAHRLLASQDRAADVAQEAFLRLYRQPPRNGREHNLRAWLLRITLNLSHNSLREEQRRARREESAALADPITNGQPDPAGVVVLTEERAIVRNILARLPPNYEAVLVLRYEGYAYAEIAEVLGIKTNAVGTMLARAEEQFRTRYLESVAGSGRDGR